MERVAVLGASHKPERYSNMAIKLLLEHNHEVYPIHPSKETIDGLKVYRSVGDLPVEIDTLTLYINPKRVEEQLDDIIALSPTRVIFNPGTESEFAIKALKAEGIAVVRGCTLIMLKTDQY